MAHWWFEDGNGEVYFCRPGGKSELVRALKHVDTIMMIEVLTLESSHNVSIGNFKYDANNLCRTFSRARESRSLFISVWKAACGQDGVFKRSITGKGSDDEPVRKKKHMTGDNCSSDVGSRRALTNAFDKKLFAQSVPVHINNLCGPMDEALTRSVHLGHVRELELSFQSNFVSPPSVVGLIECEVAVEKLQDPGFSTVQTIGGNHTRLALQSLFQRGLWQGPTVDVCLYVGLTPTEALSVGVSHNGIHEMARPLSFMEKANLVRRLRPDDMLDGNKKKTWKRTLQQVFGYNSMRDVANNLKDYITLARLDDTEWEQIVGTEDAWANHVIRGQPQKRSFGLLLRNHMRFPADVRCKGMTLLTTSGYKDYLAHLKLQKHDNSDDSVDSTQEDTEGEKTKDQNGGLRAENEKLQRENENLKDMVKELEKKIKTCRCSNLEEPTTLKEDDYQVGETVSCKWNR